MVFIVANVNGLLKIYHNESSYLKTSAVEGASVATGSTGGEVFDDDDDTPTNSLRR
jgi:hypothetical protein